MESVLVRIDTDVSSLFEAEDGFGEKFRKLERTDGIVVESVKRALSSLNVEVEHLVSARMIIVRGTTGKMNRIRAKMHGIDEVSLLEQKTP